MLISCEVPCGAVLQGYVFRGRAIRAPVFLKNAMDLALYAACWGVHLMGLGLFPVAQHQAGCCCVVQ